MSHIVVWPYRLFNRETDIFYDIWADNIYDYHNPPPRPDMGSLRARAVEALKTALSSGPLGSVPVVSISDVDGPPYFPRGMVEDTLLRVDLAFHYYRTEIASQPVIIGIIQPRLWRHPPLALVPGIVSGYHEGVLAGRPIFFALGDLKDAQELQQIHEQALDEALVYLVGWINRILEGRKIYSRPLQITPEAAPPKRSGGLLKNWLND